MSAPTRHGHTYHVEGMSCGHCKAAVRGEVEQVRGVKTVDVDLGSKEVVVRGHFADAVVRAAIEDAGYRPAA